MLIPQDFETQIFFCFKSANKKLIQQKNSLSLLISENIQTHKKALRTSSTIGFFCYKGNCVKTICRIPKLQFGMQYVPETSQSNIIVFTKLHRAKIMYCFFKAQKSVKLFSNKRPLKCDFKSMQWGLVLALIAPSKYCLISDASTMLCRLQLIEAPPLILVRQNQRCKGEFYKSHKLFIIRKLVLQALGAWHSIAHGKF